MSDEVGAALEPVLGAGRVARDVSLAPMTTFGIGGPADWFVEPRSVDELRGVVAAAHRFGQPLTMLGGGSNVLIGDRGVRGVVVRFRGSRIESTGGGEVEAEAGATINSLVRWTVHRGLAGLEAWAGTPGSVGGAVSGNAHFAGRGIGDLVRRATLVARSGELIEVAGDQLRFAYDSSRLQHAGEILVSAVFGLQRGSDPVRLRATAHESLVLRKRSQPLRLPSAGCVFRNPDPVVDAMPADAPASAGALIDRAGLKGRTIGGASISELHANFIVNRGGATASDVRALIGLCRDEVRRRWGIVLREEIVYLGEFGNK